MDKSISRLQSEKAREIRLRDLSRANREVRELLEERATLRTSCEELNAQLAAKNDELAKAAARIAELEAQLAAKASKKDAKPSA